jgi:putative flippase GtrA
MPTLLHRFGRFAVVGAVATATHAARKITGRMTENSIQRID